MWQSSEQYAWGCNYGRVLNVPGYIWKNSVKYARIVELGDFDKHFVKNTRKRGPARKHFRGFSSYSHFHNILKLLDVLLNFLSSQV